MPAVEEHHAELDGTRVFWRSAPQTGTPTLYVHGTPTNADDWTAFLALGGGIAPDLPGFGRSGKANTFDYTIAGYGRFVEAFLDLLEVDRLNLVVHDWGAVALTFAERFPERVARLVVIDAVPLLPGYTWHRLARAWRRFGVGEVVMGSMVERVVRRISQGVNATPGELPDEYLRSWIDHFDEGTQRAILKLHRDGSPDRLAAAGEQLGRIVAPALVVWGAQDPYIGPSFADRYAEALGGPAEVVLLEDAGHVPWLDRPDLVERVVEFLEASE
ncbi:MAG TPA: alpha/beta hydrolase [Solirubrobacteraceae bacterium]